jgi:hypothetical protein
VQTTYITGERTEVHETASARNMSTKSSQGLDESDVKLDQSLTTQRKEFEDCTPCRLMGSAAFTGLGVYTYWSGRHQLNERKAEIERQFARGTTRFGLAARRANLVAISATLVAVGAYRLIN